MQCQSNAFEAVLSHIWDMDWFEGAFWWDWNVDLKSGGADDLSLSIINKPAADIIGKYYGKKLNRQIE